VIQSELEHELAASKRLLEDRERMASICRWRVNFLEAELVRLKLEAKTNAAKRVELPKV
jgi:hypothetical protein